MRQFIFLMFIVPSMACGAFGSLGKFLTEIPKLEGHDVTAICANFVAKNQPECSVRLCATEFEGVTELFSKSHWEIVDETCPESPSSPPTANSCQFVAEPGGCYIAMCNSGNDYHICNG